MCQLCQRNTITTTTTMLGQVSKGTIDLYWSVTGRWVCDDRFYGLVNRSNR